MPIHHRLPPIIYREISKRFAPGAKTLLNSEKLILNYAWKGYKHKSSIVSGIRSGLLGGAIAGSFIKQNDDDDLDGSPLQPFTPSGAQDKTRSGFRRRYSSRRRQCYRPNSYRRRSGFGKRQQRRNRF